MVKHNVKHNVKYDFNVSIKEKGKVGKFTVKYELTYNFTDTQMLEGLTLTRIVNDTQTMLMKSVKETGQPIASVTPDDKEWRKKRDEAERKKLKTISIIVQVVRGSAVKQ